MDDKFDSRFEDPEPWWVVGLITASISRSIYLLGVIAIAAIWPILLGVFVYFISLERKLEKFTENEAFIRGFLSGGLMFLSALIVYTASKVRGISRSR